MPMIRCALKVLIAPHSGWIAVADMQLSIGTLAKWIIVPAALAGALAATLGTAVFNREWNAQFGYDTRAENALTVGGSTLLLLLTYSFVLAWVFARMGRMYRSSSDYAAALKVVAYGTLPMWLAGAFMFFMPMVIVGLAAFVYTCLQYSIGAGIVLGVKDAETAEFVAISVLLASILMTGFGMAASAIGLI